MAGDRQKHTAPTSWVKHEQRLRLVILPALGPDTPLRDLQPVTIQELYDRLPARRAVKAHATLRALLRFAVRKGWMTENPLNQVTPPRYRRPAVAFFTDAEWDRLVETLRKPKWQRRYPLVLFLATVPMRPSEALALTWDDIDWRHGVV